VSPRAQLVTINNTNGSSTLNFLMDLGHRLSPSLSMFYLRREVMFSSALVKSVGLFVC